MDPETVARGGGLASCRVSGAAERASPEQQGPPPIFFGPGTFGAEDCLSAWKLYVQPVHQNIKVLPVRVSNPSTTKCPQ